MVKRIPDEQIQEYVRLYESGWSYQQIGDKYRLSFAAIRESLERRGLLNSRNRSEMNKIRHGKQEIIKKACIGYQMGMTSTECGKRFGIAGNTILRNTETRSNKQAQIKCHGKPALAAKYYRFYEAGYSCGQIAEMYGITPPSVQYLLKTYGYKLRTYSESLKLTQNPKLLKPLAILPKAPNFVPIDSNKRTKKPKQPKSNVWADKIAREEVRLTQEAMEAIKNGTT